MLVLNFVSCLNFFGIASHHSHGIISSLSDIRNWIRNIEQHASDNVNKILVGNKADMDESKRVCRISRLLSLRISLVILCILAQR